MMRKNIKYSVSSILIILSLMLGYVVYAEETTNTNTGENEIKSNEFKNEVKGIRDEVKVNLEENKTQLEQMLQLVRTKREEFKTEFEAGKEQAKLKIAEMKTNFKESLKNIKNENKKISAEKIVDTIQGLNTKTTDNLSNKIDQIENVLVSIKSRISKAESNGLDVSSVKIEVETAKVAITQAHVAVSVQSTKVYGINVTSEATLEPEMKNLRDTFQKDMKALNVVVKSVHEAVRKL